MRLRLCVHLLAIAAVTSLAHAASADGPVKSVLIIHGGPESFPGNDVLDAVLREQLFSHPDIQVDAHSEYLENEEFGDTAYEALRAYLRIKLADRRPDLVIADTAPAVTFVLRYRDELFPNVPMAFISAATPPGLSEGTLRGVTGVLRQPSQVEAVELALNMHPGTRRLHVVAYAPAVDGFQERARALMAPFSQRLTVSFTNEATLPEMLAVIKTLPADSLMYWMRYSPVTNGRVIFPSEFLPEISASAPVPIYAAFDTYLGDGVVGGMMRNNTSDATQLAAIAIRILEGTAPESIPVAAAAVRPIFDWRQLQRWGIHESSLPAGADVRYRVPTAWRLYRTYILATLIVLATQLVLIGGLLRERARVRRADTVIRASEASLRLSYDRIRQMAGRLINAQETARAGIARDLHDDVCQRLALVILGVSTLKDATRTIENPTTQEAFEQLDRDTLSAYDGIRRLSHDLHPETLRLLGLVPALRAHCKEVAERNGVEVQFSAPDSLGAVSPEVAVCFFRIAQESLRNSVVHGEARLLTVSLSLAGNWLTLEVIDNGRGFDVGAMRANGQGMGLVMMDERANLVGGNIEIVSTAGLSTTVRVVAPAYPASSPLPSPHRVSAVGPSAAGR